MHPREFHVGDAWVVFQLNEEPIRTVQDGSFNCVCLMDAASCFILSNAMVPLSQPEPSQLDARRLLRTAIERDKRRPDKLFIPTGAFQTHFSTEAKKLKLEVVSVDESELLPFVAEARQGFKKHVQGGEPKYDA